MPSLTLSLLAYLSAAVAEIAGSLAFWAWLLPGLVSLAVFA